MLDTDAYAWREITEDTVGSYLVHHDMCVLGYDLDAGTLDLMIRFHGDGGHCHAHRHVTTTSVLVLSGEQHLDELRPDGTRVHKVRTAGTHHLTTGDAHPHLERGGADGAVLFFSHHTTDGRLYEIVAEDGRVMHTVTMDSLISSWEQR